MNSKNEVFEYLIDQLRQQLPVVDVMGEIKRWSIDRSIAGRGNYTDEENAIIDAYIGLEHNPYKQQCEDLAHEVRSLKNQLRDASAQIKELQGDNIKKSEHISHLTGQVKGSHLALVQATGDVEAYKLTRKQEQSGCHEEDVQECEHEWLHSKHKTGFVCFNCGARKEDVQECHHNWRFVNGKAPAVCINCGEQEAELVDCSHTNTVGLRKGFAPGFTKKCLDCGAKLK